MSTQTASSVPPQRSARSGPAPRGGTTRLSAADQLERLSSRLDFLIRDTRLGARSQHEYERLVAEAEAIADGIRAAFRSPTPSRPVHPPLAIGPGKAWW